MVEDTSAESTNTEVQENDDNMDAAKAYSESRSPIPYFVIGGVGVPASDPASVAYDQDHPLLICIVFYLTYINRN